MAVVTNAVVAICVVFVPAVAVGAFGVPVNSGEAKLALFAQPLTDTLEPATFIYPAESPVANVIL